MVSAFRPPRTQFHESFRLQFPFVFRQPQSLQLLLLAHPCLPVSFPTFSGLPLSRPIAASASLSDPRCFRFLSSASVLGSDYSASVSSFPFLPDSASQWLPQCSALASAPSVFPVLSSLISHAFLPGSRTRLPVCFLSSFLASLPQLFHECLPSAFAFGLSPSDPLPFARFSSGSDYSALCFFLSALCPFRLTVGSSSRLGSLRPLRSSPSSTAGFPSASSGSAYSVLCSFPFALPCFASHSCSAGARPSLSLRRSPLFPLPFGSLPL